MKTLGAWLLALVAVLGLSGTSWAQDAAAPAAAPAATEKPAETAAPAAAAAVEKSFKFDDDKGLEGWTVTGDATLDKTKNHGEGEGSSVKVGPKAKMVFKVGEADATGSVEFWVFDDGTKPEDPKAPRSGAAWGVIDASGKWEAVGMLYAKYISGDASYALCESAGGKSLYRLVQYIGTPRVNGWSKWTFQFDNEKGMTVLCNDKDVSGPKKRINAEKVTVNGFTSIVVVGDTGKGNEQTIWVDDITVKTTGAAKAKAPAVEAPKVEAPKVEVPKVEAPKVEAPKVEAPKVEVPAVPAN